MIVKVYHMTLYGLFAVGAPISDPCYYHNDEVKTNHRYHEVYAKPSFIFLALYYFVELALVQRVETEQYK